MKGLLKKIGRLYAASSSPVFVVTLFLFHLWLGVFFIRIGILPVAILSFLSCISYLFIPNLKGDNIEQNAIFLVFCEISIFSVLTTVILSMKSGFFLYCLPLPVTSYIEIHNRKRQQYLFIFATIAMIVMVPLGNLCEGIFGVYRDRMAPYDYMFLVGNFMVVVASYAANVYVYMRMHDISIRETKYKSEHDPLTGMYNRNYFNQYVKNAERTEKLMGAFIMFDIDNFKQINDKYGHDVGDIALKSVTVTAGDLVRSEDVFVRWGGEEFVIFIKDMDLNRATVKAEEIRAGIEATPYHEDKHLTVSLGVTVIHANEHITAALKRVDDNLYTAKTTGKNKVVAN